jgi:hypothetical protein
MAASRLDHLIGWAISHVAFLGDEGESIIVAV